MSPPKKFFVKMYGVGNNKENKSTSNATAPTTPSTSGDAKMLNSQIRTSALNKTNRKFKFSENLVETVYVESYKNYNTDVSCEPIRKVNVECNCLIY